MTKAIATLLLALSVWCNSAAISAPAKPTTSPSSPQQFVQSFYDWYAFKNKENGEGDIKGSDVVLKQRKDLLDATLYKALQEDERASAKSPGEIVGLDFDPFVAANGLIYAKYQTGPATKSGANYRIPVYGVEKGKRLPKVVVEAEVASQSGHYVFTNFHYGKSEIKQNENLINVLQQLKKDRGDKN